MYGNKREKKIEKYEILAVRDENGIFCANKPDFNSYAIRHTGADIHITETVKGSGQRAKTDSHPFTHVFGSIKPFYMKFYETTLG